MTVKRRRSPPPRRRARAAGESLRDALVVAHPSYPRVMFASEVPEQAAHPALEEAGRRTFGLLVEAITECPRP